MILWAVLGDIRGVTAVEGAVRVIVLVIPHLENYQSTAMPAHSKLAERLSQVLGCQCALRLRLMMLRLFAVDQSLARARSDITPDGFSLSPRPEYSLFSPSSHTLSWLPIV